MNRHPLNPILSAKAVPQGAADTVECLVTARLSDLLDLCRPLE